MIKAKDKDPQKMPEHVGIIMDGNGRWAQKNGMIRTIGHKNGTETVRKAITYCSERNISVLSLFAFSTENWKRPAGEISGIMNLLTEYLSKETPSMKKNNVRLRFAGDLNRLSARSRASVIDSENETRENTGLTVNIALNYGGRDEIVNAARLIARTVSSGQLSEDDITEELFSDYLYTSPNSDIDLLIRTGAEKRISNFMLWQLAYAEIYFTDILWPDFSENDFDDAIEFFQKRERRFGDIKK